MADDIDALRTLFLAGIAAATDLRALEALRVHALGKSGALTQLLKQLGTTPPDERRARGAHLNHLKDDIAAALDTKREELERAAIAAVKGQLRIVNFRQRGQSAKTCSNGYG